MDSGMLPWITKPGMTHPLHDSSSAYNDPQVHLLCCAYVTSLICDRTFLYFLTRKGTVSNSHILNWDPEVYCVDTQLYFWETKEAVPLRPTVDLQAI